MVRLTGSLLHREDLFIQNNLVHFFLTVAVSFSAGCLLLLIRSGICSPQKKPVPRVAAEIDTENLRHNVRELQSLLPEQCKIMAVVKADAYGHGAPAVAAVRTRREFLTLPLQRSRKELRFEAAELRDKF